MLSARRNAPQALRDVAAFLRAREDSTKVINAFADVTFHHRWCFQMAALLRLINDIRERDPQAKIVVFSQWSTIVRQTALLLKREEIGHVQITGVRNEKKKLCFFILFRKRI